MISFMIMDGFTSCVVLDRILSRTLDDLRELGEMELLMNLECECGCSPRGE